LRNVNEEGRTTCIRKHMQIVRGADDGCTRPYPQRERTIEVSLS
jgi:hypothetical protein